MAIIKEGGAALYRANSLLRITKAYRCSVCGICKIIMKRTENAKVKSFNERVNDIYNLVIDDDKHNLLISLKEAADTALKNDAEYKRLKKAVEDYELNYKRSCKKLIDLSENMARILATGAAMNIKGCRLPQMYALGEDTSDFDKKFAEYDKLLDTQARLVSFVTYLNSKFEAPKVVQVKRAQEYAAFSISEIRCLINSYRCGIIFDDHEQLRAHVLRGKRKQH